MTTLVNLHDVMKGDHVAKEMQNSVRQTQTASPKALRLYLNL
jgi:hypothetical protein